MNYAYLLLSVQCVPCIGPREAGRVTCQFLPCFCNNFIQVFHLDKCNISHVLLPSLGASTELPWVSLVGARQLQCTPSPVLLLLTCIFLFTFASGHGLSLKRSHFYHYVDAIKICYLRHKGMTIRIISLTKNKLSVFENQKHSFY